MTSMSTAVIGIEKPALPLVQPALSESYFQLVWRRFRKSKPAILGGLVVSMLALLAIFAEFFAPYPLLYTNARDAFIPPTRIHFVDEAGSIHLRPFVYPSAVTLEA